MEYTVKQGDTLSSIAQRYFHGSNNASQLAANNNIDDEDVIYVGQKINIPETFSSPLKFKEIPTKNRVSVIDNYSDKYNYIVEGDKIYYSRKGRDSWVDISTNDKARKNLFNFLNSKYDFRGYEDDERKIFNQLKEGKFNYSKYHNNKTQNISKQSSINSQSNKGVTLDMLLEAHKKNPKGGASQEKLLLQDAERRNDEINAQQQNDNKSNRRDYRNISNIFFSALKQFSNNEDYQNLIDIWSEEGFGSFYETAKNGFKRRMELNNDDNEHVVSSDYDNGTKSNDGYQIRPGIITGDTLRYNNGVLPNEYYLSESIPASDVVLGARNRGDLTTLHTQGAIIPLFNQMTDYSSTNINKNGSYIGIDKDGHLKVGKGSDFNVGDKLSRTVSNKVYSFSVNEDGEFEAVSAKGSNSRWNLPVVYVYDEKQNKVRKGSPINILLNKTDKYGTTYGSVTGGRVLVQVGDEIRLLSGSLSQIHKGFEDMKKRNGQDFGIFYAIDNGTFNKALRTKNEILDSKALSNYDHKNTSGGSFLYIKEYNPLRFSSDTIAIPNIRTKYDESYKNGHDTINTNEGIVLHYTAFDSGNDVQPVINHFKNPNSNASAHVLIAPDGRRFVFAKPEQVTFHAGQSYFNGRDNVNDFMNGIEFQAKDGSVKLTEQQIQSAIEYMLPIIRKYRIPLSNIVTHQQIRDNYIKYKARPFERVSTKQDLSLSQYQQIIDALKASVYYRDDATSQKDTKQ